VSDLWRDEKRSPGPWPQGKRAPLAIVAVVVALVAFLMGIGICALGVLALAGSKERAWRS
jgi:hypothetical protein